MSVDKAHALDSKAAINNSLSEMRNETEHETDVNIWIKLEQPLALRLRVAAADGDHLLRIACLEGFCLRQMRREPLVRLFPDRAGVEDDHVRLLLLGRLTESELLEHALDPLGIVGLHLATEGRDVVATHEGRL